MSEPESTLPADTAESDSPPPPPARQINRRNIGLNVFAQVTLGVILFCLVNYLGFKYFFQWDKTYNREFTLSEDTIKFLQVLDKKIAISVICSKGTPEHRDVWQLAESYHREGKSKLKIEMVDPAKDREAFEKLAAEATRLSISVEDFGIFVRPSKSGSASKRKEATAAEPPEAPRPDQDSGLVNGTFIPLNSLFQYTKDMDQRQVLSGFNGESALTGALMAVARGDRPNIYVVAHKSRLKLSQAGNAVSVLSSLAARQNMKILPLSLYDETTIPKDADAVVMIGVEEDLTEKELGMLRDYWHGKRHAILIMLSCNDETDTPRLSKFLAENGVVPQKDRVMRTYGTPTGTEKDFSVVCAFSEGSPITKPQRGSIATLPGKSCSLKLTPDAEKPRAESIDIRPLLKSTGDFWGEVQWLDESPQSGAGDNPPPLDLAASLERGGLKDSRVRMDSSRMVVIGNASLLDPDGLLKTNSDFANSSLNWLLQQDQLIGISPMPKSAFRIHLTEGQQGRIFLLTSVVLPLSVFMLGVFVWGVRRS